MSNKIYDVVIVGGGISGAALFYELAKYTNIQKICMLEKYEELATLNTKGTSNSQTIHVGDIETNYTLEKAQITKRTAKMIEKFCLQYGLENKIMFAHQKMALGVGKKEVAFITKRYNERGFSTNKNFMLEKDIFLPGTLSNNFNPGRETIIKAITKNSHKVAKNILI